ncbi:MAG: CotH kinase family protein, partial [Pseudomonadota bacterium]
HTDPTMIAFLLLAACSHPPLMIPEDTAPDPGDSAVDTGPPPSGERCEPRVDLSDPFFVEGEAIAFGFSCGSGARRGDFTASLQSTPAGATLDPGTWELTWTPAYDQGARYDLMLVVRPRGDAAAFPESALATFWVADAVGDPQNRPVDPSTYTEEWGLPVFHLDPHGTVSQTDVPTTLTVDGHAYEGEMQVRGAVSVNYPKQSYTLTFSGEDLDASRWGMGNKDNLVAITPFDDNSYVRQWLGYRTWAAMAEYWEAQRLAPRTFFAVIYLSGNYHGLYTMADRPDDHFAQEMGFSRDGNLYKSYNHDANFYRWNASGNTKTTLHDGYDKKEGEPETDWSDLDSLVAFSADHDDDAFWAGAADWIDVDDFMDWFLFVAWTLSEDSAGKNAYLYHDPAVPQFRFSPWDLNHSFGQGWYTYRVSSSTWNDYRGYNGIFNHFLAHPEAAARLWSRLDALQTDGPLRADWMTAQLDEAYALIDRSATRDWGVWGRQFSNYWGSSNTNNYEQEKAYLYGWLEDRDAYVRAVR